MRTSTLREALFTTARVTAIAACQPAAVPVTVEPAAPLGDGGALAQADPPRAKPEPPRSCDGDPDCCSAFLKSLDAGSFPMTRETTSCCEAVLGHAEKAQGAWPNEAWGCCEDREVFKHHPRFCSPWGPPMPPPIVWRNDTVACRSFEWREAHCVDTIQA